LSKSSAWEVVKIEFEHVKLEESPLLEDVGERLVETQQAVKAVVGAAGISDSDVITRSFEWCV
jgi:hypothetical protein